ncbi:unnamed protein product, partial [Staurois parvus]
MSCQSAPGCGKHAEEQAHCPFCRSSGLLQMCHT